MSLWILKHHRLVTWRVGRELFKFDAEFPASARGLVIGECPGPNTDPRTPMFPRPQHSAAGRLMKYGALRPEEYLGRLERVNQCTKVWSDYEAKIRQREIIKWLIENPGHRVLLLGRQVQKIWDVEKKGGFGYVRWDHMQIAFAPHPSGLSRVYNNVENCRRLGRYVRWCAGLNTEKF